MEEREGGTKGDSNTRQWKDFYLYVVTDRKGKLAAELMRSQLRGDHASVAISRDWIILCQRCYTREPYVGSQTQSHDLQEEVRHVRVLHELSCVCF